jgi:hypothetical protein
MLPAVFTTPPTPFLKSVSRYSDLNQEVSLPDGGGDPVQSRGDATFVVARHDEFGFEILI